MTNVIGSPSYGCFAAIAACGGSAIELQWRPFAVIQSALNSEVRCLVSEPLLPFACRHGTAPPRVYSGQMIFVGHDLRHRFGMQFV